MGKFNIRDTEYTRYLVCSNFTWFFMIYGWSHDFLRVEKQNWISEKKFFSKKKSNSQKNVSTLILSKWHSNISFLLSYHILLKSFIKFMSSGLAQIYSRPIRIWKNGNGPLGRTGYMNFNFNTFSMRSVSWPVHRRTRNSPVSNQSFFFAFITFLGFLAIIWKFLKLREIKIIGPL